MDTLKVKNFGPIKEVDIKFRDFTLFVGPQATGKSIILELFKLLIDKDFILDTMDRYNLIVKKENFLNLYFGYGYKNIWNEKTEVIFNGHQRKKDNLNRKTRGRRKDNYSQGEKVFYIPAQRVITVHQGMPKGFTEYDIFIPFIYRNFSEHLRRFVNEELILNEKGEIFPRKGKLKGSIREKLEKSIYSGKIEVMELELTRRMILKVSGNKLNFMSWSAGQKEFLPLLLGLDYLMPASKVPTKDNYKTVIIEEPEMGLHPKAIKAVLLTVIDLISRGYKVFITTHSQALLELVYVMNFVKDKSDLYELFDISKSSYDINTINKIFDDFIDAKKAVYYFKPTSKGTVTQDISDLDPFSEDDSVSSWGELLEFSNKVDEIILKNAE